MSRFRNRWRVGWLTMTVLSLLIVLVASVYLTRNPDYYLAQQREVFLRYESFLLVHISGGMIALICGPFQFLRRVRVKLPQVHRWLGRLYMVGILVGGAGGFFMAFFAYSGPVARIGFGVLAVFWLVSGWLGLKTARQRNFDAHRQWMIRSFALTFAAVTLRLELSTLVLSGVPFVYAYPVTAWLSWVGNLMVVEWWMRRQGNAQERPVFR